ncbi:MAG: phosphatidylserine decarboxylase [Bacteroidales bacterium]|nr:phosphatidylserine decarboxylase [Bacteroidales bacterium]
MKIDKNSYGTVALVLILGAIAIFLLMKMARPAVAWVLSVGILWICGWQVLFHRVPDRESSGNDRIVSSVADGRVVIIEKVFEPECLKRECIQLSIYMDFWDVHANFWPVTGEVTYTKYHPGKHVLAFKPKASEENEHTCTCIRTADGKDVFFKQLAGGFARRIVCYAAEGMKVIAGQQCGIIKFGSRIDFFLPVDADIKVSIGEEIRACETVIAELK